MPTTVEIIRIRKSWTAPPTLNPGAYAELPPYVTTGNWTRRADTLNFSRTHFVVTERWTSTIPH